MCTFELHRVENFTFHLFQVTSKSKEGQYYICKNVTFAYLYTTFFKGQPILNKQPLRSVVNFLGILYTKISINCINGQFQYPHALHK